MDPLLMIPGPVALSPAVARAVAVPPPSHQAPDLIEAFGAALERMREVWRAGPDAAPFAVPGSGTLAMDLAVHNVISPGDRALVVQTGVFGGRMAEMLRRRGAEVDVVAAPLGDVVPPTAVVDALEDAEYADRPYRAVFATHVDTSTGVRLDVEGLGRAVAGRDTLTVLDAVCALGGEACDQAGWGIDVVLTASQKALGLPPGLALLVLGPRALDARRRLRTPPPLSLDLDPWRPIMAAYEARRPSYFSTPPTSLVLGLRAALDELAAEGVGACVARHERVSDAMRAGWDALGLVPVPTSELHAANTLSALRLPPGVGPDLPARVVAHGVVVAGGLHPELRGTSFRVGHMGDVTRRPDALVRTVRAVGRALGDAGHACDVDGAVDAVEAHLR